jgi:double-strand break repair protein MRE11
MEAIGNDDVVRPDVLVKEFLEQSSLKVLPKNEFIHTLVEYVAKGSGHFMDEFVDESLTKSLQAMVKLNIADPDADIETLLETYRVRAEERFDKEGKSAPRRRLKPRPADYDSDLGEHWGGHSSHWYNSDDPAPGPAKKVTSRRNQRNASDEDVEMDDLFVSQADQDDSVVSQPPKAAPKRGAVAKKTPAPKKAPARRGRPKKNAGFVVDSDEDENEDEGAGGVDAMSVDAFIDDDEADPPAPPPPKRSTRTTKTASIKAATPRATSSRATKAAPKAVPAAKTRQSTLNFSQSQRPATRTAQSQRALEVSDDEIDDDDDDDDDDGFEPVSTIPRSRRR